MPRTATTERETTVTVTEHAPWLELVLVSNFNWNRSEHVYHVSQSADRLKEAVITLSPNSAVEWQKGEGAEVGTLKIDRSKRFIIRPVKDGFILE